MSLFYSGDVPQTGQMAVLATAGVTAVGSTVLLGYCFSPYVHTLELLSNDGNKDDEIRIRMITRDILARRIETIFTSCHVTMPREGNMRPFCNFMVRDKPYYIHPELVKDNGVRRMLVGDEKVVEDVKKVDEDEFL